MYCIVEYFHMVQINLHVFRMQLQCTKLKKTEIFNIPILKFQCYCHVCYLGQNCESYEHLPVPLYRTLNI